MRKSFVVFSILTILIAVVCYFVIKSYHLSASYVPLDSKQPKYATEEYIIDKNDYSQGNIQKNARVISDSSKQVTISDSSGSYTEPATPTSPTNLFVTTVSSSQTNLTWQDNSDNEDGFKIERLTRIEGNHEVGWGKETSYIQIAMVGPNITSYPDANLLHGSYYKYRVKAYNQVGDSECYEPRKKEDILLSIQRRLPPNMELSSLAKEEMVKSALAFYPNEAMTYTLPLAPVGLTATAVSHKEIAFTWTNLSDYDGITVFMERSTDGINYLDNGSYGDSARDDHVKPDTTYYYRVRARTPGGYSPYSNVVSVTTQPLTIAYAISQVESLYRAALITDNVFYSFLITNLNDAQNLLDNKDTASTLAKLKEIEDKMIWATNGRSIEHQSGLRFLYYIGDLSSSIDRNDDKK